MHHLTRWDGLWKAVFVGLGCSGAVCGAPAVNYSTYLDYGRQDQFHAVALDRAGNVYLAGSSQSGDPVNISDIIVAKFSSTGELMYARVFGDGKEDKGLGIAVDDSGYAYVTGQMRWTQPLPDGVVYDLPRPFVATIDPAGQLTDVSPIGRIDGTFVACANAIARDPGTGYLYLAGEVSGNDVIDPSRNFPITATAFRPTTRGGNQDGFLAVIDPAARQLIYATYLGGAAKGVAVDRQGHAYVTGSTLADVITTPGVVQPQFIGFYDAFVIKVDPARFGAQSLIYGTYLGGSRFDEGLAIAVDAAGNAFVAGATHSGPITGTEFDAFPITAGAIRRVYGGGRCADWKDAFGCSDGFFTKLDPSGSVVLYSTLLGNVATDAARGIAVDEDGLVYLTGDAAPLFQITADALQPAASDGADGFLTVIDPAKDFPDALVYSSFLGGNGPEFGNAIAVRGAGPATTAVVTGFTGSSDFPVHRAVQSEKGFSYDGFVTVQTGFSTPRPLPAPAPMRITILPGARIQVDWDNGALESAPAIDGPWTRHAGAAPMIFDANGPQTFFRMVL